MTARTSGARSQTDDKFNDVQGLEVGAYFCLFGSVLLPLIIIAWANNYHSKKKYVGCDKPNYFLFLELFGI